MKDGVLASKYEEIVQSVREVVSYEHGVGLVTICLLKTRSIPKTTSGKIARAWCKRGLKEGTLQILFLSEKHDATVENSTKADANSTRSIGKGGYTQVNTTDADQEKQQPQVTRGGNVDEIRALSLEEIKSRLEAVLIQVSCVGPTKLTAPLDSNAPLIALGLDSMTIVQYHGVLENRCVANIYLFN